MNTKQSIIENNKLIAEFLGLKIWEGFGGSEGNFFVTIGDTPNDRNYHVNNLKYHHDWNWLMPVIERIEETNIHLLYGRQWQGVQVSIYKTLNTGCNYCEITHIKDSGYKIITLTHNKEDKLKCVYDAVVDFIKWYNANK